MPSSNSIALYVCSVCRYSTDHKSNMSSHLRTVCLDASFDVFEMSHANFLEAAVRLQEQDETREANRGKRGPISVKGFAESVLCDTLYVSDTEDRLEWLNSDTGRDILNALAYVDDVVDVFLHFLDWFVGRSAPDPTFYSVVIVVTHRSNKHIAYRDHTNKLVCRPLTIDSLRFALGDVYRLFLHMMVDTPLRSGDSVLVREATSLRKRLDACDGPHRSLDNILNGSQRSLEVMTKLAGAEHIFRCVPLSRFY